MNSQTSHFACRIERVERENYRVATFTLDLALDAAPGQFVMLWLPGVEERPLSLMACDPVTLTVARVGPFTTALHERRTGERVWVRGPYGNGFRQTGEHPLLVAGGYGVAPLLFLTRRLQATSAHPTVLIGARTARDVIFVERFGALDVPVLVATDDGSQGTQGLAPDVAARAIESQPVSSLYACGPEPMLDGVAALARRHRLPAQLSYERKMRCAFGVCGTCARDDGWLVCRDGPVRFEEP
ncbi:MAG: dihydroorotate dehydrogenase electron transfer subunit [Chloroflexi bacterium]|nr:dihydroorotate dehydrogenase electron transfer subunit [Chloroflexota bacterium]